MCGGQSCLHYSPSEHHLVDLISRKWLSARTNVYFQYANMKNTYISMRNYVKHANYAYLQRTHYVLSLYEL